MSSRTLDLGIPRLTVMVDLSFGGRAGIDCSGTGWWLRNKGIIGWDTL